jgi:DNA-binding CsgD family transcriptional regulator
MSDKQKGEVVSKPVAYDQLLSSLFLVGETLLGEMHSNFDQLSQEIALLTHGQAQLVLQQETSKQSPLATPHSLPVKFGGRLYGELCIAPDPANYLSPAIPWTIVSLLARFCGGLLYTIELTAFMPELRQSYVQAYKARTSLSERERDTLVLMCQGYTSVEIATMLHVVPATVRKFRERIYSRLEVHSEREAVFAAFATGLFYPVAGLRPHIMPPTDGQ